MILKTVVVTNFATNCYIIGCSETHQGAIVDPGGDARSILAQVKALGLTIRYVINTHGHLDHIGANTDILKATDAQLVCHAREAEMLTDPALNLARLLGQNHAGPAPDLTVEEGDTLTMGTLTWQVLHTPGHTPGSLSLYSPDEGVVFTGDALFQRGIGRTDLGGGDQALLIRSIRTRLFTLPDATVVYSGHGPATTIGDEKAHNPWLSPQTP